MSEGQQIQRISDKLQELLKKYESIKKENDKLKAELLPSKERELKLLEQIEGLEQKAMVLKAGTGKMDEADKRILIRN